MIYMAVALYVEAEPLIKYMKLKRDSAYDKFQVFTSPNVRLVLTGPGEIHGAVAVSYVCALCPPGRGDIFVNFGICGAAADIPRGRLFLIHSIVEETTGRRFYPDLLWEHEFETAAIETVPVPAGTMEGRRARLVDMEAAGIYQAAQIYFMQHRMLFFKVAFDHPGLAGGSHNGSAAEPVSPESVRQLCDDCIQPVLRFITRVAASGGIVGSGTCTRMTAGGITAGTPTAKATGSTAGEPLTQAVLLLSQRLRATKAMELKLGQYIYYRQLCHGDALDYTARFLSDNHVPECCTKKEGMLWLEHFRKSLYVEKE